MFSLVKLDIGLFASLGLYESYRLGISRPFCSRRPAQADETTLPLLPKTVTEPVQEEPPCSPSKEVALQKIPKSCEVPSLGEVGGLWFLVAFLQAS